MRSSGKRQRGVAATAVVLILGVSAAASAQSATCKDELDRFERRLTSSSLPEKDPDTFEALLRQAEEASELRDEERCLQTVAALNDVIPADPGAQTGRAAPAGAKSRPSAPVLIMAGGDEPEQGEKAEDPPGANAGDEDDRHLDD